MSDAFPTRYNFKDIEAQCKQKWQTEQTYKFTLAPEDTHENIFSVDTPPPFTSGALHMGHLLNHSWIDFMCRFRRLQGKKVYLPQGFDCHGLPTELKVQAYMDKHQLDKTNRELFLKTCHEWTERYIAQMRQQFDDLGYSTDWDYTYRTMDDSYMKLVQESLLEFYDKQWLYRAKHPVHWCPNCGTSLAKQEVGYIDTNGHMWEIKLPVHDRPNEFVTIATTRPEMMEACVGVFIHPSDDRYLDLSAAWIDIPFTDRKVPVIMDNKVDMSFGTGIVYCCTFGDETDIYWQKKYDLPSIQVIGPNGQMIAPSIFAGMTTSEACKAIVQKLDALSLLVSEKPLEHRIIAHTERASCMTPIEYLPVPQWFIKVTQYTQDIKNDGLALDWRPNLSIRLVDWCDSLTWDWVISRQRVFGTPIPFWHCSNYQCDYVLAPNPEDLPLDPIQTFPPQNKCPKCQSPLIGEKDVCDCWVDSSITPLRIAKWHMDDHFFETMYPTTNRSQGYEIIRTWMFYTLFRCKLLTGQRPFSETMINGMVAGSDGRKMSKSFGNMVTPDEVIPYYGSDVVRQWAALGALGDDYPFYFYWVSATNENQKISQEKIDSELKKIEKGTLTQADFDKKYRKASDQMIANTKFLTKMWNAYRLIWLQTQNIPIKSLSLTKVTLTPIDHYILKECNTVFIEIHNAWDKYQWRDGYTLLRSFFWNTLCDNYLESLKFRFLSNNSKEQQDALVIVLHILFQFLKILSAITPFITEELYRLIYAKWEKYASISHAQWPKSYGKVSSAKSDLGKAQLDLIQFLRNSKSKAKIALNKELPQVLAYVSPEVLAILQADAEPIQKTLNIKELVIDSLENASIPPASDSHFSFEDETTHWKTSFSIPQA